jgi:serine/threonine protein kinase
MSAPHEVTTDLTVPSPAPPAPPGALDVPGYTELVEIGRGGMGTVYRARDPQFERAVAIKVMRPGQDASRFAAEARVTAQLPHPGVPPVYALGAFADGTPHLVMKLIEGRTLSAEGACPRRARSACSSGCARRSRSPTAAGSFTAT